MEDQKGYGALAQHRTTAGMTLAGSAPKQFLGMPPPSRLVGEALHDSSRSDLCRTACHTAEAGMSCVLVSCIAASESCLYNQAGTSIKLFDQIN
jgi:hypothetical protein